MVGFPNDIQSGALIAYQHGIFTLLDAVEQKREVSPNHSNILIKLHVIDKSP